MIAGLKCFHSENGLDTPELPPGASQQVAEVIGGLERTVAGIRAVEDRDDDPYRAGGELRQSDPGIGEFLKRRFRMMPDQVIEKVHMAVYGGKEAITGRCAHDASPFHLEVWGQNCPSAPG